MNRHWIVLAVGAILLPAAACIRSGQRIQATAPTMPQQVVAPATPTRPSLWAQINDALESWEDASPIAESVVSEVAVHESEAFHPLIACPKESDPHGPLVEPWIDWRRQALAALPESLRNESDHRKAIDETYRRAIRGFLSEEAAASYDPETFVEIINRPPVGGYDIGNIRFTDIDERSGGPVTREQAQAIVSNLNLSTAVPSQTLSLTNLILSDRQLIVESFDGAAPDPPFDPQLQLQAQWADWKKQAIAALPEGLREDSEYRKAIDAQHDAATLEIEERRNAQAWEELHEKLRQSGHFRSN